jgi:hypothetical protein
MNPSRVYYYRVTSETTKNVWTFDSEQGALGFISRQPAGFIYWLDKMWTRPQIASSTKVVAKGKSEYD